MKPSLIAAALLASIAGPALAKVTPVPAATPSGKPVNCLRVVDIRESRVRSDQVIDFYMREPGKVYRNTLPNICPRLGFEQAFTYQLTIGQLCSVDIIRVFNRTALPGPWAACGLGQFQPVSGLER